MHKAFVPISRILSSFAFQLGMGDHLSGLFITSELKRHFHLTMDTTLHRGKDLVVAFLPFDKSIPEGTLAFRHQRFCSHLVVCTRRALPATLLPTSHKDPRGCVRTFLSTKPKSNGVIVQYGGKNSITQTIPPHKFPHYKPTLF